MRKTKTFDVYTLTHNGMRSALLWALFLSIFLVVAASLLGRATRNLDAALTEKPDLAVYVLLKERNISSSIFLRESEDGKRRDYLAETASGKILVVLRHGEEQWYVSQTEWLHE